MARASAALFVALWAAGASAAAPEQPPVEDVPPLAGYHDGVFFLRSRRGEVLLMPGGRLQIDGVAYVGEGLKDLARSSNGATTPGALDRFFLRRAYAELQGVFFGRYNFHLGGDFAQSAPVVTDALINVAIAPGLLNLQLGQFNAPFTLENRTSNKYVGFMERSLSVRAFGVPATRELGAMVWGEDAGRRIYYSVGVFNGDGQYRNTSPPLPGTSQNVDYDFDLIGRAFGHPLASGASPLSGLQLGASGWWGRRGPTVNYAYPALTSPTGVAFFGTSAAGSPAAPAWAIVPDDRQLGLAGELRLPLGRFDVRSEVVWRDNETREAEAAGASVQAFNVDPARRGRLRGAGYYVELGYWLALAGDVDAENPPIGRPGYGNTVPRLKLDAPDKEPAPRALQLLARWEQLRARYTSNDRSGESAAHSGRIAIDVVQLGANYWAARHVRISVIGSWYRFPAQAPEAAAPARGNDFNLAHGPGESRGGVDQYAELGGRLAISF